MMKQNASRRQFLQGIIGGLGVVVTSRIGWLFPEGQYSLAVQTRHLANQTVQMISQEGGELYGGFLILSSIEQALTINNPPLDKENFTYHRYNNLSEIPTGITAQLYLPTFFPPDIVPAPNAVVELNKITLAPRMVSVSYPSRFENLYPIDVIAQYDFLRPFPIVPGHDIANSMETPELAIIEKVDFTPQPGLMVATATGYVIHWIANDILYTCISEFSNNREEVIRLVSSLRQGNV